MTKLKMYRQNKKMTQKELAVLSGVPMRTIQQYEGRLRNIDGASLNTLCDLARVLNVKFYDLIEDENLKIKILNTIA